MSDPTTPHPTTAPRKPRRPYSDLVDNTTRRLAGWLTQYSIAILRITLGLVFLGFAIPKYVPGLSPAEDLAIRTVETLSLGMLSGYGALLVTALVETFIGITLITGKLLRVGLLVLGGALVGIMSPLVLFLGDLFPSGPTLEAQYVLKDIILVAAALVITARALGTSLVTDRL